MEVFLLTVALMGPVFIFGVLVWVGERVVEKGKLKPLLERFLEWIRSLF